MSLVIEIFVTVITRPLWLFVFLVTDVKRPLWIMTLVVMVVFKNRYGLKLSNGRTKRPLPMLLSVTGIVVAWPGSGMPGLLVTLVVLRPLQMSFFVTRL